MTSLLTVQNLSVDFRLQKNLFSFKKSDATIRAVSNISFALDKQKTLGIVGESGSGKTTLARALVGIVPLRSGRILWRGTDLSLLDHQSRQAVRKDVSMIFQDPLAALNPRMTVGQIISEPCYTHEPDTSATRIQSRVENIMERVGLSPRYINRYPHEFSGGQCQRVGIARALITKPRLIICDEPVAALDVSVRAQVMNLLKNLQREFGIALILISHDLSIVKHISSHIMVMYLGQMMEYAPTKQLITRACHPYTQVLISSVPVPDPQVERKRVKLMIKGELPSISKPPAGCIFESRCPIARQNCAKDAPNLQEPETDHIVACSYAKL